MVCGELIGQHQRERIRRDPRERVGRRRHRLAASGDRRRRALPGQHRHAAEGPGAGQGSGRARGARRPGRFRRRPARNRQGADRVGRRGQPLAGRLVEPGTPGPSRRRAAPGGRIGDGAVHPSRTLRAFLHATGRRRRPRSSWTSARSSARTSTSSARASRASSTRKTCMPTSTSRSRAATGDGLGGVLAVKLGQEPGTVDGILAWDVFDYLSRGEAAALARTAGVAAAAGRAADGAVHDGAAPRGGVAPLRHRRRAITCGIGRRRAPDGRARCGRWRDIEVLLAPLEVRPVAPAGAPPARDAAQAADSRRERTGESRMAKPIIALLTDFGTRDHYAGSLKGVVLTLCPDATLVDISHDIPPHDILDGRAGTGGVLPVLPAGHDLPGRRRSWRGVGAPGPRRRGRRLPLRGARQRRADGRLRRDAAEARGVADRAPLRAADDQQDVRGPRSLRAGGRVAGPRGRGESARLGRARLRAPRDSRSRSRTATGSRAAVLRVDRFGNLVTNIPRAMVERLAGRGPIRITAGATSVGQPRGDVRRGGRRARSARCSAVPITSRSPRTAATPPTRLGLAAGAPVEVVRPSDAVLG